MNILQFVERKLSGRKVTRWIITLTLGAVGLSISIAFLRWSFGAPFPPIPGEGILVAAVPAVISVIDNITRSWQHANTFINPHGGPAAP